MRLRTLQEADVDRIRQWPGYPRDMSQMDYALRAQGWLDAFRHQPGVTALVAEDGHEVIGFTLLIPTGRAEAEFRIALRADRIGQGLGRTIAALTLQQGFTGLGLSRIHLIVRTNNFRGIRLYQRLGFRISGECRRAIQGGPVDFWMMATEAVASSPQTTATGEDCMNNGRRRALIVIDVQNEYIDGNLPIEYPPVELSLANIGRAMDAARAAAIPVVVVQNILPETMPIFARGSRGAALHRSITKRGWDHLVLKELPSAFAGTGLAAWLRAKGIDTLTIVGYMIQNCDLSTVVQGMHAGFTIELLDDATGALPYFNRAGSASAEEMHRVMTVVMQARFASVITTDEWFAALATGELPARDSIFSSNQRGRQVDGQEKIEKGVVGSELSQIGR
jgi:nicotinamidase-related amidase/RimJ/RimL family protein N-acetyltransferase